MVEGGKGIPVIDKEPECVCDDQGAEAHSDELGVDEFVKLGHTLRIWTSSGGVLD